MKQEEIAKQADEYSRQRVRENERYKALFTKSEIAQAFEDGAKWRINSVWHPNTENPNDEIDKYGYGKDCLVQVKYKTLIELVEVLFENDTYVFLGERETYTMDEVVRWAYVSDLMPDGKDEKE